MITVAFLLAFVAQDTTGLSPRARAMLDRFPPPTGGEVSIATRFSTDTAWVGQQVELVTAAWFPLELRDRLRHSPSLQAPSLSGLWSVQTQAAPVLAARRLVGRRVYDLFVAHQTIFPLGPGPIVAPSAVLTYAVPVSASFFAPEERKSLSSRPTRLMVRAIPASLAARLGNGPTARALRLTWRGSGGRLLAGVPTIVELAITGEGNVTLWPEPEITWPASVRVYPEPSAEHLRPVAGRIAGEKVFRYTIVADSAGVVTLPAVSYPFFDPATVEVGLAQAAPFSFAVGAAGASATRQVLPVGGATVVPLASRLLSRVGPGWWLLAIVPPLFAWWWPRRRRRAPVMARTTTDAEGELRRLLREPVEAGPERIARSLRLRGVPRDDAEQVRRWLVALTRRRYGPGGGDAPGEPAVLARVLQRLRVTVVGIALLLACVPGLRGQGPDGAARYRGGDYEGAARAFAAEVARNPLAAGGWRDLGTARWMSGDDIGAAAAWLRALALAPRDPLLREVWRQVPDVPGDVRSLGPTIPVSRDEALLVGLLCWMTGWLAVSGHRRRTGRILLGIGGVALALAAWRWRQRSAGEALLRSGAQLLVSPYPVAPVLADVAPWSLAYVEQRRGAWYLVSLEDGRRGWIAAATVAAIGPLD